MNSRPEQDRPAKLPESYYYGIRPTISFVAAEMDDMSVSYPTQGMVEAMADRVYEHLSAIYPDQEPQAYESAYQSEQFFRRRRLARDLLTVLILDELLFRRRHYWRY